MNESRIDSDETAAAVTTLATMLRDLKDKMDERREELRKPWRERADAVQRAAKPTIDLLDAAVKTAGQMVQSYRDHLERLRQEEQRKRDAEAAEARAAEEEAARKRAEADAAGDTKGSIKAELEELQARDRAASLTSSAGTIVPSAPIRAVAGTAGTHTVTSGVITDSKKAVAWLHKNQRAKLLTAIDPIIQSNAKAGVEVLGVTIEKTQQTRFRR